MLVSSALGELATHPLSLHRVTHPVAELYLLGQCPGLVQKQLAGPARKCRRRRPAGGSGPTPLSDGRPPSWPEPLRSGGPVTLIRTPRPGVIESCSAALWAIGPSDAGRSTLPATRTAGQLSRWPGEVPVTW